jgi:hypothetical protein
MCVFFCCWYFLAFVYNILHSNIHAKRHLVWEHNINCKDIMTAILLNTNSKYASLFSIYVQKDSICIVWSSILYNILLCYIMTANMQSLFSIYSWKFEAVISCHNFENIIYAWCFVVESNTHRLCCLLRNRDGFCLCCLVVNAHRKMEPLPSAPSWKCL